MKKIDAGSFWMLVAGLLFACMGVLVKIGAQKFTSTELVFYRSLFGLLAILLVIGTGRGQLRTRHWRLHLSRSLLGFAALSLFFYAIANLPLATAITLNYTSPLFLAALALVYLRKETRPVLVLAIVTGFCGVALLLQPSFSEGSWFPATMGLLSGLLAGIVYLQVTRLGRLGEPEWRTVFYFTLACTAGSGIWMLSNRFHSVSPDDCLLLGAMGACATLAQLAMTRAYRVGDPLVAGSLAYSTVVIASLLGILLWNETLSLLSWLGVAMIIASGVLNVRFSAQDRKITADFDKSAQAHTL